jgi:hypothetical protein
MEALEGPRFVETAATVEEEKSRRPTANERRKCNMQRNLNECDV